jgi:AcrR family transcriptional regulator
MVFKTTFEHSEALIDAALKEFAAKGYEQASINTILKAAGMSKGQFYYHFENKERLYLALIGILIERKRTFLTSVMQPGDFQGDIFTIFETQLHYGMAFAQAYPVINRFAARFAQEQGSPIYEKALAIHNFEDNQAINQLIDAGIANGDFRQDLPASFIKKAVAYLFTHAADLADLGDPDEIETNMGHLIAFMKSGLARHE